MEDEQLGAEALFLLSERRVRYVQICTRERGNKRRMELDLKIIRARGRVDKDVSCVVFLREATVS